MILTHIAYHTCTKHSLHTTHNRNTACAIYTTLSMYTADAALAIHTTDAIFATHATHTINDAPATQTLTEREKYDL